MEIENEGTFVSCLVKDCVWKNISVNNNSKAMWEARIHKTHTAHDRFEIITKTYFNPQASIETVLKNMKK